MLESDVALASPSPLGVIGIRNVGERKEKKERDLLWWRREATDGGQELFFSFKPNVSANAGDKGRTGLYDYCHTMKQPIETSQTKSFRFPIYLSWDLQSSPTPPLWMLPTPALRYV